MNVIELKQHIENKTLDDSFLILKYEDVPFIAVQYVEEIAKFRDKKLVYVDSFNDIAENIFGEESDTLYVLRIEKLNDPVVTQTLKDKIIICKTLGDYNKETYKEYIVEIPKLQMWHIKAYAKKHLEGLNEEEINWLCETCKDIYRLQNEIDKIAIFHKKQRQLIFRLLNEENAYGDLSSNTIFNFTNAIIKKDIQTVRTILNEIENIDIEPMGVVTILYKSFKNLLDVQLSSNATPESLGMTQKQYNAIRYNCNKFTNTQLIEIFDAITSIDLKLKSGELPNELIIDYLLTTIFK